MDSVMFRSLQQEVDAFKQWASGVTEKRGEWETEYLEWNSIYNAAQSVIGDTSLEDWNAAVYELVLYSLARDNEVENILQMQVQHPEVLVAVANKALAYTDSEARWQIAHALGEIEGRNEESIYLLSRFSEDNVEYVRRRALAALGRRQR
ncbi:hypothetical protein PaecuDRAFT_2576 [Paenibacillus curdlanolyticus YK9]|uniref:HEAT repeat domain-containing protein n=1 Tax=Paenibacillus curdlanolyticus YK9 TaxID=717606 RepID=E0IA87_9BACL|nr:HEAT repeat domain-containing protein [Paenibacillus curdlanolyticus]EFM10664.1 hypothetical protein PaecuDRAFT_2576 [Paenibacillus curdlanolyticus YK9]